MSARVEGPAVLRLTGRGWEVAMEEDMRLLGRIAAGRGLEAVAEGEAYSLATELFGSRAGKGRYLLRVVGQSMVRAGIEEGDLLVVEEDDSPPDGEIVVALVEGGEEVMVKRLYREEERVRLRSESDTYEDIVLPSEAVLVQGRVLYVIHSPRI